jgi:hypothetical protein
LKIRMQVGMSGTRAGQSWPPVGETLDVSDVEGAQLCHVGIAIPVADKDAGVEKAVAPEAEERGGTLTTDDVPVKRGPGRPRKNP